ncbi:MAG: hypothetical protein QOE92_798 [Chloroflexota bacterium]|nr:hypothetical protein [Chloroflexota bacterium]
MVHLSSIRAAAADVLYARHAVSPFALDLRAAGNGALFSTGDASQHAVVTTGTFDLLEAGPEVRRRQVNMFEDLLAGLSVRFEVLVGSRPAIITARDARLRTWLEDRAGTHPAFERDVSIVISDEAPRIDHLADRWRRRRGLVGPAPDAGVADGLLRQADGLTRQLTAMGLQPRLLRGVAMFRFLDARLPGILARTGDGVDWQEDANRLTLDGELSRTFFLDAFPGVELAPGWLGHFVDLPCAYDLAIHGFKVAPASVLRILSTRIRDLQATRMSDAASGSAGDPLAEAGLPEAVGLRREIAANQQHAYSIAAYLTVTAADEAELDVATALVHDAAARAMARVLPATVQMAPARLCTLPLGLDPLGRQRLLPGAVVATMYPWLWDSLQDPAGRLAGFRVRDGGPVLLDTFDEGRFSNANVGVFGHSGAGKTHLMKSLLLADADAGVGAFIVDPEAEYRGVCDALGGQWVDLALGAGASINVLDPALAAPGGRDPVGDQVIDLIDLLGTMCGTVSDDDRVDLDEVLRDLLERGGGTLLDVRQRLEAAGLAPRVARALRRWTEGQLGEMFARPTNLSLDADVVVFGIRDLKDEILPVAYFLIAQWIWARVRSDQRPRRLLFDEVGLLFEYPLVRRFLVRLARRVRKYQGSLCLVTQNAGDLLSSDQGLVLATNPATLFLGAQRQAEAQRLQRAVGLTDGQADFLANARRGEFLLLAGDGRHRVRVEAPPWQSEILGRAAPI